MTEDDILKFNIEHIKNSIPGIDKTAGANKKQLAKFLNISIPTIDRAIAAGSGIPEYIKGHGAKGHLYFPLVNIALFLTNSTVKTA